MLDWIERIEYAIEYVFTKMAERPACLLLAIFVVYAIVGTIESIC